jgi:hypothetical protein
MPTPVEIKKSFSAARILGNGDDRVTLSENELFCLLTQCCSDLAIPDSVSKLPTASSPPPPADYYRVPLAWFQSVQANCPSAPALVECLAACVAHEADFRVLPESLCFCSKYGYDIEAWKTAYYTRFLEYPRVTAPVGRRSNMAASSLPSSLWTNSLFVLVAAAGM